MVNFLLAMRIVIVLTPHTPVTPTLKQTAPGRYLAINPTSKDIKIMLSCGDDWEYPEVNIHANSTKALTIKEPNGEPALCVLITY